MEVARSISGCENLHVPENFAGNADVTEFSLPLHVVKTVIMEKGIHYGSEMSDMIDMSERKIKEVKRKIERIKEDLPNLQRKDGFVTASLRIEGLMQGLPEDLHKIGSCIMDTEGFELYDKIWLEISPVWRQCADFARQEEGFPWNDDAKAIGSEIDRINRWFARQIRDALRYKGEK